MRRLPLAIRDKVLEEIKKLERSDVIERIEASEWISALVVVTRSDGRVRLCVDLRAVNQAIVADVFPLPHFEDLLTKLEGAKVFSKLDALSAYHQVELSEDSRDLTAFITPWGLFRFKRVPFGLASAPAAFQRMMEKILEGIDGAIIYLDDVLICGRNRREHDERLRQVLERIRAAGMTLNKKCVIQEEKIEFVGYEMGQDGIRPTAENLKAIEMLPEPTNATQIKSVLGTASFYMRCVPEFSTISEPMRRLLKADKKFEWGKEQSEAFQNLKKAILEAKPLAIFDHSREIVVACDASDVGCGACLLQKHDDGERPISFASCALTAAQRNYSTGEKEALACVFAIERWHVFLYGRKFRLRTDRQALVTLLGTTGQGRAPMRIARWVERLRKYNFSVEYRPGSGNNVPDMLSRLPSGQWFTTGSEEEHVVAQLQETEMPISWEDIAARSKTDSELVKVRNWLRRNNPRIEDRQWASVIHELAEQDGVVLRAEKIVLPGSLRRTAIGLAHDGAHQGMCRTKQRLRQIYWWPAMDREVEEQIRECSICANSDRTARPVTAPAASTPWPERPWEKLAVDIRGPDSTAGIQNRFAIVVIDYYSKWAEVEFLQEVSARKVVEMFQKLFNQEGIPCSVVSDNGSQFISLEFKRMLMEHGIKHHTTPVYSPATNGLCERFNRTLGGFLATAKARPGNIRDQVLKMVAAYNATPQATTGKSPAELLHGRRMRTKLDVVGGPQAETDDADVRKRVEVRQEIQRAYADSRRAPKTAELQQGMRVQAKKPQWRKGESRYNPPIVIEKRLGRMTYKTSDGRIWHRNSLAECRLQSPTGHSRNVPELERGSQPILTMFFGDKSFDEESVSEPVEGERVASGEVRAVTEEDTDGRASVHGTASGDHEDRQQQYEEEEAENYESAEEESELSEPNGLIPPASRE